MIWYDIFMWTVNAKCNNWKSNVLYVILTNDWIAMQHTIWAYHESSVCMYGCVRFSAFIPQFFLCFLHSFFCAFSFAFFLFVEPDRDYINWCCHRSQHSTTINAQINIILPLPHSAHTQSFFLSRNVLSDLAVYVFVHGAQEIENCSSTKKNTHMILRENYKETKMCYANYIKPSACPTPHSHCNVSSDANTQPRIILSKWHCSMSINE